MEQDNKALLIPSSIVLGAILIVGAILYTSGSRPSYENTAQVKQNESETKINLSIKNSDHILGNPNAKISVIEYSDFECPFCSKLFFEIIPKIRENFIKSGKINFVYRHFPLRSIHKNAQKAAEASECAGEQGKFWEYHDIIFENQNLLSLDKLKSWAIELNLNTEQFNSCLDSEKYSSRIDSDYNDGLTLGISGTPATFINGKLISGALPYEEFEKVINETLK